MDTIQTLQSKTMWISDQSKPDDWIKIVSLAIETQSKGRYYVWTIETLEPISICEYPLQVFYFQRHTNEAGEQVTKKVPVLNIYEKKVMLVEPEPFLFFNVKKLEIINDKLLQVFIT